MKTLADTKTNKTIFFFLCGMSFGLPLIFTTKAFDPFTTPKITLFRISAGLLLGIMALKLYNGEKIKSPQRPIAITLVAFLALLVISTLFSVHSLTSILGLRKRFFGLSTYLLLGITMFASAQISWDKFKLRYFFYVNVISGVLVSLLALAQFFGLPYPKNPAEMFGSRAYATFGNPNFVGIYLIIAAVMALSLLQLEPGGRYKGTLGVFLFLIIAGLLSTQSAGAIGGAVIAFFVYIYLSMKNKVSSKTIFTLIIVFLIIISSSSSLLIVYRLKNVSIVSRLMLWQGALRLISRYPLFGVGLDAVKFRIMNLMPYVQGLSAGVPEDAHNLVLTYAAMAGVPALIAFALIWILIIRSAYKRLREPETDIFYTAAIAIFAGYLVSEMINPEFIASMAIIWILFGIVTSQNNPAKRAPNLKISTALLASILIIISFCISFLSFFPLAAEFYLVKAAETNQARLILNYYKQAQSANPFDDFYSAIAAERLLPITKSQPNSYLVNIAIDNARDAIRKAPDEATNYVTLGAMYLNLAEKTDRRDYYSQAEYQFKKALVLNKYEKYAVYLLAQTYLDLGKPDEAAAWKAKYTRLTGKPFTK